MNQVKTEDGCGAVGEKAASENIHMHVQVCKHHVSLSTWVGRMNTFQRICASFAHISRLCYGFPASCMLRVHISLWECVCSVCVCVSLLTLASCSCRGSLVASGQLSSWERCSHTIWANLSTLPLSACSNSHAWHTHVQYIRRCTHISTRGHIHHVHNCLCVHTKTSTQTHNRERMAELVGIGKPRLVYYG